MAFFEIQRYDRLKTIPVGLIEAPDGESALALVRESGLPTEESAIPTYLVSAPKGGYPDLESARVDPQLSGLPVLDPGELPGIAGDGLTPPVRFLAAWEAAGRPQVESIHYPRHGGRSTSNRLGHRDVLATVGQGKSFKDDGKWVELAWSHEVAMAEGVSSENKLIFERP